MLMGVDVELQDLELTACGLEATLIRMEKLSKQEQRDTEEPEDGDGLHGLVSVPLTHEAIFNHSRRDPHAQYIWISKASTVDCNWNLGHSASRDENRKFGAKARKVFLCQPPSML
jgi:hypothetical protein